MLLAAQVASGVVINQQCSSHVSILQEQEMQRSFALTNPDARVDSLVEKAVMDSIHQLKALRARLTLQREVEKLRVYGVPLDEHLMRYLRTALVSYSIVYCQSAVSKNILRAL
jgi:hypothetical protein